MRTRLQHTLQAIAFTQPPTKRSTEVDVKIVNSEICRWISPLPKASSDSGPIIGKVPGRLQCKAAGQTVHWRRSILVPFLCLARFGLAAGPMPISQPLPLRAAVPLLCTENNMALRTRLRGTGLIADSGGTLLTAAHVILQARSNCVLSVMIPDDEWTHVGRLRRFLLADCHLNELLDLAVCRVQPADNPRDWGYIRAAPIRFRPAVPGEEVWVTSFTGWALVPLTRSGHLTGRRDYHRQDGCRCDFATDIVAVEGMSGSPVISNNGEVLGILTQAGKGKFRGSSFGVSFDEARGFLAAQGLTVPLRHAVDQEHGPSILRKPTAGCAELLNRHDTQNRPQGF